MQITSQPVELHASPRPDATRIEQAAREFEGLFAQMLIKSMRDASFGDSLFPGENQLYRDLYDQQLAKSLTDGPGLGLAAVIARQLGTASESVPTLDTRLSPSLAPATPPRSPMDAFIERLGERIRPAAEAVGAAVSRLPAAVANALPAVGIDARSPEGFVASVWPHAQHAARQLGVDPRALVAQAALETGWGRRMIQHGDGASAHNLFGIKATGWQGERAAANTHEYRGGVRQNERAEFRAYSSPAESFDDYVRLLKHNPRYRQALEAGGDVRRFAQALQGAGYATDPGYASKISAIANGPTMQRALAAINSVAQASVDSLPRPARAAQLAAEAGQALYRQVRP
ncbi:flagellar assembly peptidoglycan hydrolase FlgJ [Luteimonas sp. A478]